MIVLLAEQLTKRYPLDRSPAAALRYALHPKPSDPSLTAVDGVSFALEAGDSLGVLGASGAGKSTLLKMLAGVTTPTSGKRTVNGQVGALFAFKAGFNPEQTGLENARISLMLAGIPKKQADACLEDILSFADIGALARMRVKTYSSDTLARLGFAMATAVRPDVLLVDETLCVSDLLFQARCIRRIKDMLSRGTALVLASPDISAVKFVCRQCLLLHHGKADYLGATEEVIRRYIALQGTSEQSTEMQQNQDFSENQSNRTQGNVCLFPKTLVHEALAKAACEVSSEFIPQETKAAPMYIVGMPQIDRAWTLRVAQNRFGDGRVRFESVQLLDAMGLLLEKPVFAQTALLRMLIVSNTDLNALCVGYRIKSSTGANVIYSDTAIEQCNLTSLKSGQRYIIEWQFYFLLGEGAYNITTFCSVPNDGALTQAAFCDYVHIAVQFDMQQRQQAKIDSLSYWPNEVRISSVSDYLQGG